LVSVLAISLYVSGVSLGRKSASGLPAQTDVPKTKPARALGGRNGIAHRRVLIAGLIYPAPRMINIQQINIAHL
jgi:hypothetical protein